MKLLVIGASGRSGRLVVAEGLRRGHTIATLVRKSDGRANVDEYVGDARNSSDLKRAATGCDAVISVVGHGRGAAADMQQQMVAGLLNVIPPHKPIVFLTGTGVRQDGDRITFTDRILNLAIRLIDPGRVVDAQRAVAMLKEGNCDYRIVRVLKLTSGPLAKYQLLPSGPAVRLVSRRSVAAALLDVAEDDRFSRSMPIIGSA